MITADSLNYFNDSIKATLIGETEMDDHGITRDNAIKELEELFEAAGRTVENEEFLRGWKCALLAAMEIVWKISFVG